MKYKNLRKKAIDGLNACTVKRADIAEQTGLGFEWLNKLAQGKMSDPSVVKIEKLLNWLSK